MANSTNGNNIISGLDKNNSLGSLETFLLVEKALKSTKDLLQTFANRLDFLNLMKVSFGEKVEVTDLQKVWASGDFSSLPPIQIRRAEEINFAKGAFAGATNTVYLSSEFLSQNADNPEAIVSVLLEEIGHSIDWQVNEVDSPGDEGEIFAALVRGKTITESELKQLKNEDDSAIILLDGQAVQIEQATGTSSNPFYKFEIVAKTGDKGMQRIENRVSINDLGKVAFIGDLDTSVFGSNAIFVGSNSLNLKNIVPGTVQSNLQFGTAVQINNGDKVIARWGTSSGLSTLRLWNANGVDSGQLIADGGGFQTGFSYPFDYYSILPIASVNNNGKSVFVAFDKVTKIDIFSGQLSFELGDRVLVTPSSFIPLPFNERLLPSSTAVFPVIADDGSVLVSESQSGIRAINLYDNQLSTAKTIAITSPNGFTQLGNSPGISDDGSIVVFAGDRGNGVGIFVSIDTGSGRQLITIAGENNYPNFLPLQLGYGNFNPTTGTATPIVFNSFDINSRIGVSHVESGKPGILDDTFVVSFIGTPSQASRNNPITGQPLLFSDKKGLWTIKVTVDSKLDGSAGFDFNQTSATPVVQVGDVINGATVNDISVYDPIANVGTNPSPNNHQIAFVANTSAGEMVIKAEYLDTDEDGLLDDWEENGIDIDRDGIIDLDLKAMGADKNKKDLFLEIDWLAPDGKRDFSPDPDALNFVGKVFQKQGITLHIDAGSKLKTNFDLKGGNFEGGDLIGKKLGVHYDLVYFNADFPSGPSPGLDFNGDGAANYRSFQDIKDNFFGTTTKNARELVFRYAVFADESGSTKKGSSGRGELQERKIVYRTNNNGTPSDPSDDFQEEDPTKSDFRSIPGNDLIVSLAGYRSVKDYLGVKLPVKIPSGFLQGQTLLHELGHTLGLRHGGQDNTEAYPITSLKYNPGVTNYLGISLDIYKSVMNYLYQLYPDTTNLKLIQDYSSSSPFDDWSNIKLGFSDYFTTLGNSYGIFSQAGASGGETETKELTINDIIQILGSNALDDQVPTISSISTPANISIGNSLAVDVTATDNVGIQSVDISFDLNGDGDVSEPGETVAATLVTTNQYQATFTNITGTVGSRIATATVTDLANFTTVANATVSVNSSSNTPPQAANDTATTNEDTPININVLANDSDANGTPLSFTLATTPTNGIVTINNNGTPTAPTDDFITYTPNANFNGTDTFTYTLSDGKDTATATVQVTVTPANDAPTLENAIADQTTNEDSLFSFQIPTNVFSDVDAGDSLSYSASLENGSALPNWLTFNTTTRTFSGTPGNSNVGEINVKVTATDGSGVMVSDTFKLTIANVNDAPVVQNAIADQTINEDNLFNFVIPVNTFSDIDAGDAITYSATLDNGNALPSWLSFNGTTFSGTPTDGDTGAIDIKITATDKAGAVVSDTFKLTVNNVNNNNAPILHNAIADQKALTTQSFSFTIPSDSFKDIDAGDSLTYSATLDNGTALPSWLTFNATTRTFSGTPGSGNAGILNLKVTATDTQGLSVSDSFELDVLKLISGTANNDTLNGTVGNDYIKGLNGRDTITGSTGNDVIVGGASGDILTGGLGKDQFVYTSFSDIGDTIKDFTIGDDKIVLTDLIDSLSYSGSDPIGNGYVRWIGASKGTSVQIDPDGSGGSGIFRPFIQLDNISASNLNADSFVF